MIAVQTEEAPKLIPEADFHLGLIRLADLFYWYKNSETIEKDVEAWKALQKRREAEYGRAHAQAV